MTGTIYYPALNLVAAGLHVSEADVALTITTYMVSCPLIGTLKEDCAGTQADPDCIDHPSHCADIRRPIR